MSEWGGDDVAEHPVLSAGAALEAVAAEVVASSGLSLSLAQVQGAALSLHRARQALEAAHLHVVRLLATKEDRPAHPGAATRHFLADELGIGAGSARADLEAARATEPDAGALRGLGGALAAGQVTRQHVDVAVRVLRQLPTGTVRDRREEVDAVLTGHARSFCPADARQLGRYLLDTMHPRGVETGADDAFERRSWTTRVDDTGMVVVDGALDPVGGAEYLAVLGHLSAPRRPHAAAAARDDGGVGWGAADDGDPGPGVLGDLRTPAQRRAEAQVEMARLAARALRLELPGAEPPRVVVHTTVEQLAWRPVAETALGPSSGAAAGGTGGTRGAAAHPGPATCEQTGPVSTSALHRHACDAHIERVVLDRAGAVVSMTSAGRLASRAQRRALAARDGGCTWPGCSAPPAWCDAHHVVWWSRGGPTVIGNLVLLCARHHTEAHREQWSISMVEGVPWFTPPRWLDPGQVPVRNTFHVAVARVRRAGARLAAGAPPGEDDLPP